MRYEGKAKVMKEDQRSEIIARGAAGVEKSNHALLKLAGGALAALFAWAILSNLHDIKRYIKMSTM